MKSVEFCTACGNKREKHHLICTQCGQRYPVEEEVTAAPPSNRTQRTLEKEQVPKRKPSSKRPKLLMTLGILLLAILLGGYFTGKTLTSKDRVIDKLEQALKAKDPSMLVAILHSSDPTMDITEENIQPFISYIKANPHEVPQMLSDFRAQAAGKKQEGDQKILQLKKEGKQYLFFDQYTLQIRPVYLELSSNYEGAEITVNDHQAGTIQSPDKPIEYGPVLPGTYTVKAVYDDGSGPVENEREFSFIENDDQPIPVEIVLENPNEIAMETTQEEEAQTENSEDSAATDSAQTGGGEAQDQQTETAQQQSTETAQEQHTNPQPAGTLDPNLDVESMVKVIRGEYNNINNHFSQYRKEQLGRVTVYRDSNQVIKKAINHNLNAEFYYWDDGALFFIFHIDAQKGENRFYFYQDQMIRYIDPHKTTMNLRQGLNNETFQALETKWRNHSYDIVGGVYE